MLLIRLSLAIGYLRCLWLPFALGHLEPITSPDDSHLLHQNILVEGIDRICPEHRTTNILVLYYDQFAASYALFSAVSRWLPVMLQNSNFLKPVHWDTQCVVGFFNGTDALKVLAKSLVLICSMYRFKECFLLFQGSASSLLYFGHQNIHLSRKRTE